MTANLRGYGTEVMQVTLEPGEQRSGVRIVDDAGRRVDLRPGHARTAQPLGGVTLTASNGDVTRTTTSLTEGDRGCTRSRSWPSPAATRSPPRSTGTSPRRRLVTLERQRRPASTSTMVKTTGAITGIVESSNGGPLPGANIRVSRDELFFETNSAVAPDPGSFTITDLPPGTYLVEFSRFDHAAVLAARHRRRRAGRRPRADRAAVPRAPGHPRRTAASRSASSTARTTPLVGAEVRLVDVATGQVGRHAQRRGHQRPVDVRVRPAADRHLPPRGDQATGLPPEDAAGVDRARPRDGRRPAVQARPGRRADPRLPHAHRARRLRRADLPDHAGPARQPVGTEIPVPDGADAEHRGRTTTGSAGRARRTPR